ncbi:glycosyltransferase [Mesorhizobium sp. B2-5-13]|uniref:rhamnan synthesis F family protein n=1 Tax=unclassified Mesorhizobium TaxID=325217 RepID=UPI00112AB46F|nr:MULTISPECIES: rhamnan synthesis F family protein [unclassified Mesorhizobium]TPJ75508.1 glycosyltransferase [Mesorhizobium sp. B2-5-13]TPK41450.1 glycosyltransferase [Mesorhizobium sp. B2-5-5]
MKSRDSVIADEIRQEFVAMLEMTGFVDADYYRSSLGRPELRDPVGHYAEIGWRIGLEPNARFNGDFLRPFYEAAGIFKPPAYVWLELSALVGPLPANRHEADQVAADLRLSPTLDAEFYAHRLPAGMDPVLHYALVGEPLGWRASPLFDAAYYRERYPEIASAGFSPLLHFDRHGRREGRRGVSVVDRLEFPPLPQSEKPVVLLISHEASRTGAPMLGWNLARELAKKATVVSLMMRGGELENDFIAVAASSVGPLTWEDWHAADATRLAKRIVEEFKPLYAIANSIETQIMVPALASFGVPSVALVHEFAAYTRPVAKMRNVYDWAKHIVFPAQIVAQSSYDAFPGLEKRPGIHVMAQGRSDTPPTSLAHEPTDKKRDEFLLRLQPEGEENSFLVLGAGSVHIRKGVDLFVSAAATAKRLRPNVRFRFVWIGHGYDPEHDSGYSAYLAYQIAKSDLGDSLVMLDAVSDLEPAYAVANAFFLSSRLDPQPNVAIDTIVRGIPTVCFQDACGTAEILGADVATRPLIAPHLDVHAAAVILCGLADDRDKAKALGAEVARVGHLAYNMNTYVQKVDEWGKTAAAALHDEDLATLMEATAVDLDMVLPPGMAPVDELEAARRTLQQWSIMGLSTDSTANPQFRRPCPGFNLQSYAQANPEECGPGQAHPLAHWLRAGRPVGSWSRDVFKPTNGVYQPLEGMQRVALHAHFYYEDLADDLAFRLKRNRTRCDLFLSTDTDAKARHLRAAFGDHHGSVEIKIVPNRGRDVGPLLTEFLPRLLDGSYNLIGHVHAKKSVGTDAAMGEAWRHFLWENLVGGEHAMLDLAAAVFASNPVIGLLMAEDPHLVGWNDNREIAEDLARRMGITTPLADFFDFPLGTMFWCRPKVLFPLLELDLDWNDYPSEPVPYDGTVLHAIERLLPFVARKAGFDTAGLRVPGTNW